MPYRSSTSRPDSLPSPEIGDPHAVVGLSPASSARTDAAGVSMKFPTVATAPTPVEPIWDSRDPIVSFESEDGPGCCCREAESMSLRVGIDYSGA